MEDGGSYDEITLATTDCDDCAEAAETMSMVEADNKNSSDSGVVMVARQSSGISPVMKGLGVSAQRKKLLSDVLQVRSSA